MSGDRNDSELCTPFRREESTVEKIQDKINQDKTRQDKTRQDKTRQDKTKHKRFELEEH